ncbi:MAG: hypothetical protein FWE23_00060 [Chitinivibrionia bacterium]|nr:hypothetical protein [Chitinivibrionia bacterium]
MKIKDKITLEDLLLCTPYEKRFGRDMKNIDHGIFDLTEEIFSDHLLAKPHNNIAIDDDTKKELLKEHFTDKQIECFEKETSDIELFKSKLKSNNSTPLFIRGYSGSGKTTFIQSLLFELNRNAPNKYQRIVFNFQESREEVYLFGTNWVNKKFKFMLFKVCSILLKHFADDIHFNKTKKNKISEIEYKNILKHLYHNFEDLFSELPDQDIINIFSIISKYVTSDSDTALATFRHNMYNAVTKLISFDEDDNGRTSVRNLLKLIYVYYVCKNGKDIKHFALFDNIEYYMLITMHESVDILDCDITNVVETIKNSCETIDDLFEAIDDEELSYSSSFKTIFAVRDASYQIISSSVRHNEDFPESCIDVSNFYDINEIISKKCEFFESKSCDIILENKLLLEIIDVILSDKTLKCQIWAMFNNNKRRILKYLYKTISMYRNVAITYRNLMEKAKHIAHTETKGAIKHGARQIILRLLYDFIQQKDNKNNIGYFQRIQSVHSDDTCLGFGYARKILTYLSNKYPVDLEHEIYVEFKEILDNVFRSPVLPQMQVPADIKADIGNIINVLNDSQIESTRWCQLIILDTNNTSEGNFKIKITDAGRAFVRFCSDFEYYSCRYCPESLPLFAANKDNAIKTLKEVKKYVLKCINNILLADQNRLRISAGGKDVYYYEAQFSNDDTIRYVVPKINGKEQTHIAATINKQIGYLNSYRLFLINENENNRYDDLIKHVLQNIHEYVKRFEEINNLKSSSEGQDHRYFGKEYYSMYKDTIRIYFDQLEKADKNINNPAIEINGRK